MIIYINALQSSSNFLKDSILASQEQWFKVNLELAEDVLLFSFGDHIDQDTDLHIEIMNTDQIKVVFLVEDECLEKKRLLKIICTG